MAKDQSKAPHGSAARDPLAVPVPPALAKRGLVGVTSNLPEGMTVDCTKAFMLIFGDEAMKALLAYQQKKNLPPTK